MNMKLLWDLFWLFARVALFSWGGGPASLALMQREVVDANWISNEEFADAVAISNALPGPIAPQVSAYVGYKLSGIWGAISATAGTVFPTTILMLIMIAYFFNIKDSPTVAAMLKAVRPVVVGLLLWTAYIMAYSVFSVNKLGWGKGLIQNKTQTAIALVTFAVLTLTDLNPVWLVLAGAALGFVLYR
ncbi:MAG: chromate transporter [Anaerolineales bacterium]|nr:chromate transporter [Anaerolineales bacterium]MCZ2122538.1 chromate transporter [Anaerolineales bacterium]